MTNVGMSIFGCRKDQTVNPSNAGSSVLTIALRLDLVGKI
jgi:hypothetical protein